MIYELGLGRNGFFRPSGGSSGETEQVVLLAIENDQLVERWTNPGADEFTGTHTQWYSQCTQGGFTPANNLWKGVSVHTTTKPSSQAPTGTLYAYKIHHGDYNQGPIMARWLRIVRTGGFTDFWILGQGYNPTQNRAYITRLTSAPPSVAAFLDMTLGVPIGDYARAELNLQ